MNLLARSACKEVRTDELSFIDHGLYNWDPVSSLCFMTFLCPEQKLMVTEAGSFSLPLFLGEKCFCISIRYMLYVIVPLFRLRFLEKYLIKNVENTMSEPLEPPPPPPHPLKKTKSPLLWLLKLTISGTPHNNFCWKNRRNTTSAGTRREVHVSITYNYWFAFRALKGLYYENTAILGQFCAEVFNKKIHDCLLEILLQTDGSPDLYTFFGQMK